MARSWLPTPGVIDFFGSQERMWEEGHFKILYGPDGKLYALIPIDASAIGSGLLHPDRLNELNLGTALVGLAPPRTLEDVNNDAALGAQDPAARINAGSTPVNGQKIALGTLDPEALDPALALLHALLVGNPGSIQSDNYDALNKFGFKLSKSEFNVFFFGALWYGILKGTINIDDRFTVDALGRARVFDPAKSASGLTIENDGRTFWGAQTFEDAQASVDIAGNFTLLDSSDSKNLIQLGAIEAFCERVQFNQRGGQVADPFSVVLTPLTRGSSIYYSTNGADPKTSAAGVTLYSGPFDIHVAGTDVTVKAVAVKLGVFSEVSSYVFTTSAGTTPAPTFINPSNGQPLVPGTYINSTGTLSVALASAGSPSPTIRYTLWKQLHADGTPTGNPNPGDPSDSNGLAYSGPISLNSKGTWVIRAFAKSVGLLASAIVSGTFVIKLGTSPTDGSGGGNIGGGGHSIG